MRIGLRLRSLINRRCFIGVLQSDYIDTSDTDNFLSVRMPRAKLRIEIKHRFSVCGASVCQMLRPLNQKIKIDCSEKQHRNIRLFRHVIPTKTHQLTPNGLCLLFQSDKRLKTDIRLTAPHKSQQRLTLAFSGKQLPRNTGQQFRHVRRTVASCSSRHLLHLRDCILHLSDTCMQHLIAVSQCILSFRTKAIRTFSRCTNPKDVLQCAPTHVHPHRGLQRAPSSGNLLRL